MEMPQNLALDLLDVFFTEQLKHRQKILNIASSLPPSKKGQALQQKLLFENPFIQVTAINKHCTIYSCACPIRLPDKEQFAIVVLTVQIQKYESTHQKSKNSTLLPCLIPNEFVFDLMNLWGQSDYFKITDGLLQASVQSVLLTRLDTLIQIRQEATENFNKKQALSAFYDKNHVLVPYSTATKQTIVIHGCLANLTNTKIDPPKKVFIPQSLIQTNCFKDPTLKKELDQFGSVCYESLLQNAMNVSVQQYLDQSDQAFLLSFLLALHKFKLIAKKLKKESITFVSSKHCLPAGKRIDLVNKFEIYNAFYNKNFAF